jgi:hypothetical protein
VEKKISDTADVMWRSMRSADALGIHPLINRELTIAKVDELIERAETQPNGARPPRQQPRKSKARLIKE